MPSGGPRPKHYESVRQAVEDLRAGATPTEIQRSLHVSDSWAYEFRKLIETFGTTIPAHPYVYKQLHIPQVDRRTSNSEIISTTQCLKDN